MSGRIVAAQHADGSMTQTEKKNRKQFVVAVAIALGSLFISDTHPARAQGQPVIRLGECAFAYQPVCARSRKRVLVTYANACVARANLGHIVADGVCPENCPSVYKPVCARDADGKRRTFMNACAAKKENAKIIRNTRCLIPSS